MIGLNIEDARKRDLIQIASEFASSAHASINQRRKYTNQPYIVHPRSVAAIVARVTDDEATIAAAWLHDVVEDTPVELDEIRQLFGEEVARLVDDLTDVSRPSDGPRRARKQIDRDHTAQADRKAKSVKLADIIDNLSDFESIPPKFALVFLEECELLVEVLGEGDHSLLDMAKLTIERCQAMIDQQESSPL